MPRRFACNRRNRRVHDRSARDLAETRVVYIGVESVVLSIGANPKPNDQAVIVNPLRVDDVPSGRRVNSVQNQSTVGAQEESGRLSAHGILPDNVAGIFNLMPKAVAVVSRPGINVCTGPRAAGRRRPRRHQCRPITALLIPNAIAVVLPLMVKVVNVPSGLQTKLIKTPLLSIPESNGCTVIGDAGRVGLRDSLVLAHIWLITPRSRISRDGTFPGI
jgi:hypothetical protein